MKIKDALHSVVLRYMISYAVIMVVLFSGVGIYINNSYANISQENSIRNSMHQLNSIRYQHEENLNTLLRIGKQIGLSPYISSFQLLEDPLSAFHLLRQLVPYTVTNDFCYQLYLIFHEDNYIYSSATSAEFNTFLYILMSMENTPPETLRSALRNQTNEITIYPMQTVESILTDGYRNKMVTVIVPISIDSRFNVGTLMFLIKESTYLNILGYDADEQRNTYIVCQGKVLAKSITMDVDDEAVFRDTLDLNGEMNKEIAFDGKQYQLIALNGAQYDMQYITLVPMEMLWAEFASKQLGIGIFLLFLSIPCMALTIFFSRRHAKPIQELRYLFPPSSSTSDVFVTIHDGIEALVGRNKDLNEKISQNLPVRQSAFVRDLVKCHYLHDEDAIEAAKELGMNIDKRCFVVALVSSRSGDDYQTYIIKDNAGVDSGVSGYGTELVALEQGLYLFFADKQDDISAWLHQTYSSIKAEHESCTFAVSGIHHTLSHIGSAYLEASAAYDNRFVMGNEQILRFRDVSAAAKDIVPFTRSYLDGFRKALRSGNIKDLNNRISELTQYLRNTEMSLFAFRMIYNKVITAMLDERIEQYGKDVDAVEYYDIFTLTNCHSIADLDDLLRKLSRQILSGKSRASDQKHPMIHEIAAYLQNSYAEPMLQMGAIADAYNISAASLSLDFKEAMGMSPSDYLLLLRMEKAKELLRDSALSVKEIGAKVGYIDASSFIRRFRQYMAMTPAQYRQMIYNQKNKGATSGTEK